MPGRAIEQEQGRVLAAALARARALGPGGVVVFDLDSTLLDNRPRQARILRDYGRRHGVTRLQRARPEHWTSWDLRAALANAGLSPAEVAAHAPGARRFWAETFFTSEYCRLDVPLPGAPEFARAIAGSGAVVAYVTGRPLKMEAGTREVLARFGFPPPDGKRAHLFLKPGPELGDEAWKALARQRVEALGEVAAAFDNEPAHVNAYAMAWPDAACVHLDTDHSGREIAVLPRVPSVRDFRLSGLATAAALSGAATDATAPVP